jgi:hypothetical protein
MFAGFHEVNRRARGEGKRWSLVGKTECPPNAIERKVIAEESNKISRQDLTLNVASVLVIPNGIVRAVVTGLSWMIPHMAPVAAAPTPSAAVDVAVERLRAVGLDVSQLEVVQAKRWFLRNESTAKLRVAGGGKTAP